MYHIRYYSLFLRTFGWLRVDNINDEIKKIKKLKLCFAGRHCKAVQSPACREGHCVMKLCWFFYFCLDYPNDCYFNLLLIDWMTTTNNRTCDSMDEKMTRKIFCLIETFVETRLSVVNIVSRSTSSQDQHLLKINIVSMSTPSQDKLSNINRIRK